MGERAFIQIVKWAEFQHYKDRNPPWIKLHRDLMTSETWVSSDSRDRELAIAIMMLAAATENRIPADPRYIRRVAYLDYDPDLCNLIRLGFIELIGTIEEKAPASDVLADARPETEERQRRAEAETEENPLSSSDDENVSREAIAEALNMYRAVARDVGLPRPQGTQRQRKLMKARLREHGLDGWQNACAKIRGSPFLQGKKGWPGATLDWICKLANFEKTIEGNYDRNDNDGGEGSRYVDFLRRGDVPAESSNGAGGEPLPNLKLVEA